MKLRLQITLPAGSAFAFEHTGPALRVGRNPDSELLLRGEGLDMVSWNHLRIELTPAGAFVSDLKSSNGTFLDDARLEERKPLLRGNAVRLGQTGPTLKVVEVDLSAPPAPADHRPDQQSDAPVRQSDSLVAAQRPAQEAPQPAAIDAPAPPRTYPWPRAVRAAMEVRPRTAMIAGGLAGIGLLLLLAVSLWRRHQRPVELAVRPDASPTLPGEQQPDPNAVPAKPVSAMPNVELREIGRYVGQRGLLEGVEFMEQDGAVVVSHVAMDSLAHGKLQTDDTIKGIVEEGKLQAEASAAALTRAITQQQPGTKVLLRVQRGREVLDVPLLADPPSVLLQRQRDPDRWGRLRSGSTILTDVSLVSLPGYRSPVYLKSGVRLTLWGNVPAFGIFPPLLESAVTVHNPDAGVDLDLTLDRGRIVLANTRVSGPVRVCIRFQGEIWDLVLKDRNSEVALELWGLDHREGFLAEKADANRPPVLRLDLFARGRADLQAGGKQRRLAKGAHLTWWSRSADKAFAPGSPPTLRGPRYLKALPSWWTDKLVPGSDPAADVTMLALQNWSDLLGSREGKAMRDAVLGQVRKSDDPGTRQVGILILGALDGLTELLAALEDEQPEVRSAAGYALGHWLKRGAEQERELLQVLQKGHSENAGLIVGLLHDCPDRRAAQPATYQRLIALLGHEDAAVRELAWEQLAILAPDEALKAPFDATGEEDRRKETIAQWKEQIPTGALPRRLAAPGKPN
jgi:hypothetical protein